MARLIESPEEPKFIFELTRSEIDAINSIISDLADPNRHVVIDYTIDISRVVPTDLCYEKLAAISAAFEEADPAPWSRGYDFYDWYKKEES